MNIFLVLYNELLWRPLFNGLLWIYVVLPWQDIGIATILLSLGIRAVLAPLLIKQQRAQKDLAEIQPEIKRIQEQHKNNKEEQTKAIMELYKTRRVNPFSGCAVMLIQLPILIALFHVFQKSLLPESLSYLYSFVPNPGTVNTMSAGIINLAQPNIYFGVVAAAAQFLQTRLTGTVSPLTSDGKKTELSQMFQWQMSYILPVFILVWSYSFPSILVLYWTSLNVFGIIQELAVKKMHSYMQENKHGSGNDKKRNSAHA